MPVKMKALRTFRGRDGEGNERNRVKAGTEFNVENDARAQALVRGGMAVVVQNAPATKEKSAAKDKAADPKPNKAAEAGPTPAQAGGKTGEGKSQSSSRPAQARGKPAASSKKSKDETPPAS